MMNDTDFTRDFEDLRVLDIHSTSAFEGSLKNEVPVSVFKARNRNPSKEYHNVPVEIDTAAGPSILRIFYITNIFYHTRHNADALTIQIKF